MLLRSITKHVKEQNWFAVMLDFFIVVVGILIAFQITNWNERRNDIAAEQKFLQRLIIDVDKAMASSERLRDRRIKQSEQALHGLNILLDKEDRKELTDDECLYIAYSHDFTTTASSLPSFNEMLNSGRFEVIRNAALTEKLASFQQSLEVLNYWLSWGTRDTHNLMDKFPELIEMDAYYDDQQSEVWSRAQCDSDGMKNNRQLLNNLGENVDTMDGFLRDALIPWSSQLKALQQQLQTLTSNETIGKIN